MSDDESFYVRLGEGEETARSTFGRVRTDWSHDGRLLGIELLPTAEEQERYNREQQAAHEELIDLRDALAERLTRFDERRSG